MRGRNIFLLLLVAGMGLFAWRNWAVFSEEKSLSLFFTQITAPFGLLMLSIMAVLVLIYFLYTVGLEAAALLEIKKYARELLAARKLADEAEASRFSELKKWLEGELSTLKAQSPAGLEARLQEVLARIDRVEQELREDIERAGNTLAAYIGELEDQLTGQDRHPPPR
ncbi:DNA cytosine methyltransferase [Meiothermus sp. QL-1]|uniref:DNA cytosine methyltransferase n=1 Tax=Meiothermus sp. QL-1 TaxID=2058095 RepID=UPI000E0AEC70|nr:DNA cytosine methyltransferase [Meiothermus sp. QL-1]RDI95922.1 DNA cytosine methyltransferase [Meiothermus sp. QL-1]